MDKQTFEAFVQQNVKISYQQTVLATAKPAIRLRTEPTNEHEIAIGSSKIGGLPDLPAHVEWPLSKYDNQPLSFVAQIRLQEIKVWDVSDMLPKDGIVYFFSRDDAYKVLYYNGDNSQLERRFAPELLQPKKKNWLQRIITRNERRIFECCRILPSIEYTMHHWTALYHAAAGIPFPEEEPFDYETFFDNYYNQLKEKETTSRHVLLGYATSIQSDYVEVSPRIKLEDWNKLTKADVQNLSQWTLLLQVDSDYNTKMCWGDWGRLYFLIEKEKLKKADFSDVDLIVECY